MATLIKDSYISTENLGHETSKVLCEIVLKMLKNEGLNLANLFVISRDNPNVMKSFGKLLIEELSKHGNPKVVEAPCNLHPTHTSFKKGLNMMDFDTDLFLVNIHGWFKLSTARREDLSKLREELEMDEVNEFFLRHVSTRWLMMEPVIIRIIKHWDPLCEYYCVYIFNSKEKAHIDARQTDRYKQIQSILKPSQRNASLARLKLALYLSSKTKIYLETFQSEKPLSHKIYPDSCILVKNIAMSVVKEEYIPKQMDGKEFENLATRLNDSDTLLPPQKCDFGPTVKTALLKCSEDVRTNLRKEFRAVTIEMLKYLMSHLPLQDKFLRDISYAHPVAISHQEFIPAMLRAAKFSKRFSDVELNSLDEQLKVLKMSPSIPKFDEKIETIERYWILKVIDTISQSTQISFAEFSRLIKIISVYPNSQAFLERGFNDTKRMSDTRQNISERQMESLKIILDGLRCVGGPLNLVIGKELIVAHQNAHKNYKARLEAERREKEKELKNKRQQNEQENRKRKFDLEMSSWEEKVANNKSEIKVIRGAIDFEEKRQSDALEMVAGAKSSLSKESGLKVMKLSMENIKELRKDLDRKQDNLSKLMGKKPKNI